MHTGKETGEGKKERGHSGEQICTPASTAGDTPPPIADSRRTAPPPLRRVGPPSLPFIGPDQAPLPPACSCPWDGIPHHDAGAIMWRGGGEVLDIGALSASPRPSLIAINAQDHPLLQSRGDEGGRMCACRPRSGAHCSINRHPLSARNSYPMGVAGRHATARISAQTRGKQAAHCARGRAAPKTPRSRHAVQARRTIHPDRSPQATPVLGPLGVPAGGSGPCSPAAAVSKLSPAAEGEKRGRVVVV